MNNHEMISQAAIEYGQRVSESRIKHNLSQLELARMVGVGRSALQKMCTIESKT